MMTSAQRFSVGLAAAVVLAGALSAQPTGPQRSIFERADEGVGDVEPLGVSLRDMQVDLRRPAGFDSVFRFDRTDAFGRSETMFMRMDGGITAVFPQSVYEPTHWGLVPTIPPGTVFYIGKLPAHLTPEAPSRPAPPGRLDLSMSARAPADKPDLTARPRSEHWPPQRPGTDQGVRTRSIWTDGAYRDRRIEALLGVGKARPISD